MTRFAWIGLMLGLAGFALGGCGDDDGDTTDSTPPMDMGDTGTDAGPVEVLCPQNVPNPDEQMLPCCYRVSNADRLDAPEFRVTNLQISEPAGTALVSPSVLNILAQAVEEERFNWLMQATVVGNEVTVNTGYGEYDEATGVYSFVDGVAPGPGDPDRWNPVVIMGTLEGDTFSAPPVPGAFAVPIFNETGDALDLELPLNSFEVISATFSDDRSCIGERVDGRQLYQNYVTGGQVRTFITVEDARISIVTQLAGASLCNLISGADCDATAPADWRSPPDGFCDAGGVCDSCDFAATGDCNAWEIVGSFAAAGVEIE